METVAVKRIFHPFFCYLLFAPAKIQGKKVLFVGSIQFPENLFTHRLTCYNFFLCTTVFLVIQENVLSFINILPGKKFNFFSAHQQPTDVIKLFFYAAQQQKSLHFI